MKILVIGTGQVGAYLIHLLINNGHQVKAIDNRDDVFAKVSQEFPEGTVAFGEGTSSELLEEMGIREADVVVAVAGNDEVNLVVSTLAKFEFNVPKVVARVNHPNNAWLFDQSMGVDAHVNQSDILAQMVAEDLDHKEMFTLMKLSSSDYSIVQVQISPDSLVADKSLSEITLPANTLVISLNHDGERSIPNGSTVLSEGDSVMILTDSKSHAKLKGIF